MDVTILGSMEVSEWAVRSLGLADVGVDLFSAEAISASLRRAASFICPATTGRIARAVFDALAGLPGAASTLRSDLDAALDRLIAYGDLVELKTGDGPDAARRIFLGPPSYVRRAKGSFLLLGVRPEGAPFVDEALTTLVGYEGHTRTLRSLDESAGVELLHAGGLREVTREMWLRTPGLESVAVVVDEYVSRLNAAGASGDVDGMTVLDHAASVSYYRGRWRRPRPSDTGEYVARRPQAYGADLWCFASLAGGQVTRLIDLPVRDVSGLGRDEAWRLQAALDAGNGHPQQLRLRPGSHPATTVLDLFSPLPSWAQRYLDTVGVPLARGRGALFSYGLEPSEAEDVAIFLSTTLWMSIIGDQGRRGSDGI